MAINLEEHTRQQEAAARVEEMAALAKMRADNEQWAAFLATEEAQAADHRLVKVLESCRHWLQDLARNPLSGWATRVNQSRIVWRNKTYRVMDQRTYPPVATEVAEALPGRPNADTKVLVAQAYETTRETLSMRTETYLLLLRAMQAVTPMAGYGMGVAL